MSMSATVREETDALLASWIVDPNHAREIFRRYRDWLLSLPDVHLTLNARPGVSFSLRATQARQQQRPFFCMIDIVDDEPDARWLSVCFFNEMVTDPDERGDVAPGGLLGHDALCLNLEEDDPLLVDYIQQRLAQAHAAARSGLDS